MSQEYTPHLNTTTFTPSPTPRRLEQFAAEASIGASDERRERGRRFGTGVRNGFDPVLERVREALLRELLNSHGVGAMSVRCRLLSVLIHMVLLSNQQVQYGCAFLGMMRLLPLISFFWGGR